MATIKKKNGRGCGGGRSASPAMQIKNRQRWAASFLDWCNLGVKAQGEGLIIQLCGSVNAKKIVSRSNSRSKSKGRSKKQKQKQKQKAKAKSKSKCKSNGQKQKAKAEAKTKAEAKSTSKSKNKKQKQ